MAFMTSSPHISSGPFLEPETSETLRLNLPINVSYGDNRALQVGLHANAVLGSDSLVGRSSFCGENRLGELKNLESWSEEFESGKVVEEEFQSGKRVGEGEEDRKFAAKKWEEEVKEDEIR
jgi:hypothetical protein